MKFASLLLGLVLTAPALHAQAFGRFAAYEHCHFSDGLTLVETSPLAKGIEGRTVKTIMGTKSIPLAGGTRLLYGYPGTQPFASARVEQIPTADYKQAKQDLIANFEMILNGTDPVTRNYELKPRLNGAEIYGLDRTKLEGAVVGIYLFFIDRTHTVTTIDFLNQPADLRKFASLEEYAPLRDHFITTYTHCATGGTSSTGPAEKPLPPPPAVEVSAPPAVAVPDPAPLPDAPLPNGAAAESAPASTFVEPVARPVNPKPTTKATPKAATKSGAKPTAKPAPKPAAKSIVKKSAAHPEKKPTSAKSTRSAKPAAKSKKPDEN